jgi:hypothetical protein
MRKSRLPWVASIVTPPAALEMDAEVAAPDDVVAIVVIPRLEADANVFVSANHECLAAMPQVCVRILTPRGCSVSLRAERDHGIYPRGTAGRH